VHEQLSGCVAALAGSPYSADMLVNTPNAPHPSLRLREVESSAVAIPDFQLLMGPLLELHA
jgi:hypothetical protein